MFIEQNVGCVTTLDSIVILCMCGLIDGKFTAVPFQLKFCASSINGEPALINFISAGYQTCGVRVGGLYILADSGGTALYRGQNFQSCPCTCVSFNHMQYYIVDWLQYMAVYQYRHAIIFRSRRRDLVIQYIIVFFDVFICFADLFFTFCKHVLGFFLLFDRNIAFGLQLFPIVFVSAVLINNK